MTNKKQFLKNMHQWELGCLIYKIAEDSCHFPTFRWVDSDVKIVFYLPWKNKYSNLKTTCHIKSKFSLRTKVVVNLFLTEHLKSVTATLNEKSLRLKSCLVFGNWPDEKNFITHPFRITECVSEYIFLIKKTQQK